MPGVAAERKAVTSHPYAQDKRDSPYRTERAKLSLAFPGALPAHGVLVARGNILSPLANWLIVDLDSGTMRRAVTRLRAGTSDDPTASVIEQEASGTLTDADLGAVILAANRVWADEGRSPPAPPDRTDALCSVVLLDADEARHAFGSACPSPQLVELLDALAEASGISARSGER